MDLIQSIKLIANIFSKTSLLIKIINQSFFYYQQKHWWKSTEPKPGHSVYAVRQGQVYKVWSY